MAWPLAEHLGAAVSTATGAFSRGGDGMTQKWVLLVEAESCGTELSPCGMEEEEGTIIDEGGLSGVCGHVIYGS